MNYSFLLKPLSPHARSSQERRLYANLRQAIIDERFGAGYRLPSTRDLAAQLAIARNSAIHAYEQLAAEGYIVASRRGTQVAAHVSDSRLHGKQARSASTRFSLSKRGQAFRTGRIGGVSMPLTVGIPDINEFPIREWKRVTQMATRLLSPSDLGYGPAGGSLGLRTALSDHLRAARELRCTPDRIFIMDGTQSVLDTVAHALADRGDVVWVESPSYPRALVSFDAAGLTSYPIAVDNHGIILPTASVPKPRLIYVTPSHQYPLGAVMARDRRLELIARAMRTGAIVLEDDYDSDFRYDGEPLPALQGLADDAPVIYVGTFSKTMFPGLRLAYMVVPDNLVEQLRRLPSASVQIGRAIDQEALAIFISEGRYARHLRRMRRSYIERHAVLRNAIADQFPGNEIHGADAGLHVVLMLDNTIPDEAVCQTARKRGVNPTALSTLYPKGTAGRSGLLLGFGNTQVAQIEWATRILAATVRSVKI